MPGRLLTALTLVSVVFAVVFAAGLSQRLSDQAVALLVGVVCGMGAGIPVSLLIVWASRRRGGQVRPPVTQSGGYPPVVVLQPPRADRLPEQPLNWQNSLMRGALGERRFTVVGGEEEAEL
jgi:hypothetical protein